MLSQGSSPAEVHNTIEEHGDGDVTVASYQDVDRILKQNAELRKLYDGYNPDRSRKRVAQIPMIVVHKWIKRYGFNALEKGTLPRVLQLLDDPEWAYLKTSEGRTARRPLRAYHRASTASPVYLDASLEIVDA